MDFQQVIELDVGGVTKADLLERLTQNQVDLNQYAKVLFADHGFTTSPLARRLRLAIVTLPQIGLPNGGVYAQILEHAAITGLEPCPLEIAPHLRLHLMDQAEGQYLTVASLKLREDDDLPNGFYLRRREDGLWLRGYESGPENVYAPNFSDFAFVYPEL